MTVAGNGGQGAAVSKGEPHDRQSVPRHRHRPRFLARRALQRRRNHRPSTFSNRARNRRRPRRSLPKRCASCTPTWPIPAFNFGLPLRPSGTAFQRRVWAQIAAIPNGQTHTYGELAKALKNAPRAVGQACGANPYPLVVPCHRVVATGGGLGGFARERGGFLLDVKRWLLKHEGSEFASTRG